MSFNEKLHTLGPDVRALILKYLHPSACYVLFRAPQLKRKFDIYQLASSDPNMLALCYEQNISVPKDIPSHRIIGCMNLREMNKFSLSGRRSLDSAWYYGAAKRGDFWVVKWLYHHKKIPINGTVIQSCVAGCQKEMIKYFSKIENIYSLFYNKYNPIWGYCLEEMMKKPQACEFLIWLFEESPLRHYMRENVDVITSLACNMNKFDVLDWLLLRGYPQKKLLSKAKGNEIVTQWLLQK